MAARSLRGSQLRSNLPHIFSKFFPAHPTLCLATSPSTVCLLDFFTSFSLHLSTLHLALFSSLFLLHCHLVLTPSPQSLHSSSSGDEVQLFNGILPLVGESHPSCVGVTSNHPSSASAVGVPATMHAHPWHGGGAAVVVVACRRVGVHLDHVVAVHGRRDADVLLRLGLLVVTEPAHGGHYSTSCTSVASSHYQAHCHQPVLQTVRGDQEPLMGPGTRDVFILSDIRLCSLKQQFVTLNATCSFEKTKLDDAL